MRLRFIRKEDPTPTMRLRFMAVPTVMERKPGSPWGWRHRGSVPGARVVKAAKTLAAAVLGSDPNEAGGQRVTAPARVELSRVRPSG
jgi:hypothetical protein